MQKYYVDSRPKLDVKYATKGKCAFDQDQPHVAKDDRQFGLHHVKEFFAGLPLIAIAN